MVNVDELFASPSKLQKGSPESGVETVETNPFVRFRPLLHCYHLARSLDMSDSEYVELVRTLSRNVREVETAVQESEKLKSSLELGECETPPRNMKVQKANLDAILGSEEGPRTANIQKEIANPAADEIDPITTAFEHFSPLHFSQTLDCFLKNESVSVGQSHKARHLFALMISLQVLRRKYGNGQLPRLAVASCGNAGLAAAVVAKAANCPIDVFVPPSASPVILDRLRGPLKANVEICTEDKYPTPAGEEGADPCVTAFKESVEKHGSIPFSVQGNENGMVVDGAQTLLWEMLVQIREIQEQEKAVTGLQRAGEKIMDHLFVQCGGGALGSAQVHGLRKALKIGVISGTGPQIHAVQASGNQPLLTAIKKLRELKNENSENFNEFAAKRRRELMIPTPNPQSVAHGILDNETYDWLNFSAGVLETKGQPICVEDPEIREACETVRELGGDVNSSGIYACHTGCVGVAGMKKMRRDRDAKSESTRSEVFACIVSGQERD